jgi:hypothetical protein
MGSVWSYATRIHKIARLLLQPYGYGKTSLNGAGGYSSGGGYSGGYGGGYHPAAFAAVTNDGQEREFIAGVPDMSKCVCQFSCPFSCRHWQLSLNETRPDSN